MRCEHALERHTRGRQLRSALAVGGEQRLVSNDNRFTPKSRLRGVAWLTPSDHPETCTCVGAHEVVDALCFVCRHQFAHVVVETRRSACGWDAHACTSKQRLMVRPCASMLVLSPSALSIVIHRCGCPNCSVRSLSLPFRSLCQPRCVGNDRPTMVGESLELFKKSPRCKGARLPRCTPAAVRHASWEKRRSPPKGQES